MVRTVHLPREEWPSYCVERLRGKEWSGEEGRGVVRWRREGEWSGGEGREVVRWRREGSCHVEKGGVVMWRREGSGQVEKGGGWARWRREGVGEHIQGRVYDKVENVP